MHEKNIGRRYFAGDVLMKVLIVKTTSLGDVIHTLPALTDAHKNNPNIRFDWLVEESFQTIPSWHGVVDNVITVATRRWRKNLWASRSEIKAVIKKLREEEYDVIIDPQGLLKSAMFTLLARGRRKIGYHKNAIKEPVAARLYKQNIEVTKGLHAVAKIREFFSLAFGYNYKEFPLDYGITQCFTQNEVLGKVAHSTKELKKNVVFLHATTWASKHWPIAYWQQLGVLLNNAGYAVYLPWGSDKEKAQADKIAKGLSDSKVLPKMNLDEVAAVLSQADAVVAVDTGLGHLTAALGRPCVNIYGATDADKTGAMGDNQIHMSAQFACAPCLKKQCKFAPGADAAFPPCYKSISSEAVFEKIIKIIN